MEKFLTRQLREVVFLIVAIVVVAILISNIFIKLPLLLVLSANLFSATFDTSILIITIIRLKEQNTDEQIVDLRIQQFVLQNKQKANQEVIKRLRGRFIWSQSEKRFIPYDEYMKRRHN